MWHSVSIVGFFALLCGLAALLEWTVRAHGPAIIAALRGPQKPPRG